MLRLFLFMSEQISFYKFNNGSNGRGMSIAPTEPWTTDTVLEHVHLTIRTNRSSSTDVYMRGSARTDGANSFHQFFSRRLSAGTHSITLTQDELDLLNGFIAADGVITIAVLYSSSTSGNTIDLLEPSYYTVVSPDVHVDITPAPAEATAEMLMPGVEALSSPHVDHAVALFTAEASMPMPEIYPVADVAVEATVVDTNATMLDAAVSRRVDLKTNGVHRLLSSNNTLYQATDITAQIDSGYSLFIPVPWGSVPNPETNSLNSMRARFYVSGGVTNNFAAELLDDFRVIYGTNRRPGPIVNPEPVAFSVSAANPYIEFDIPQGKTWIRFTYLGSGGSTYIHNPGNATSDAWFHGDLVSIVGVDATPEPADATAEMLHAHAEGQAGVHTWVDAMFAEAEMLNGVFPDANTSANVMDANALMGAAWFKSDRDLDIEPMLAAGTMLNDIDVNVVSNIHVNVAPGVMEEAAIIDPEEVDYTVTDPYWMRVTGRSAEGVTAPRNSRDVWMRLAERRGSEVYRYDTRDGSRSAVLGNLMGDYRWGANGPNGKRGLRVINAGLEEANYRNDGFPDTLHETGASYEFTIRMAPGHTGRMDILNGEIRKPGQGAPTFSRGHVSIRDGHIYAESNKGGTSWRRIDDNRWHHVVITPRDGRGTIPVDTYWPLDIYIDGERDRSFVHHENNPRLHRGNPRLMARPRHFFGQDTGFPFVGEITNFVFRENDLGTDEVRELYMDMFGHKPVRAGAATGAAEMLDGKVESNMKRMLVLTFNPWANQSQLEDRRSYAQKLLDTRLVTARNPVRYTAIMEHGLGENTDVGNYRLTMQWTDGSYGPDAAWEVSGGSDTDVQKPFRDERTGQRRLINLQEDVNLDDFDVIFVQDYTNPALNNQEERLRYEAFFNSLNQALVDGHKLMIHNPYLAADLGWATAVEMVEVLPGKYRGERNDVRSYDIAPYPEMHRITQQPAPRPANGSKPELGVGYEYTAWGAAIRNNLWGNDVHHNNGYRVVNEVDGLTTLPSWEVEELYYRHQTTNLYPDDTDQRSWGYRLTNRSAEHLDWTVTSGNDPTVYEMSNPSEGIGLKAGDEFYDYIWTVDAYNYYWHLGSTGSPNTSAVDGAIHRRIQDTFAIPPGHLRVGTPITTFRSTIHDDFGREVPNPYRNHIRNAVIRPGDTLTDGRKVKGYAYMDFASSPTLMMEGGTYIGKHLTLPAGVPTGVPAGSSNAAMARRETEESVKWDFARIGRHLTSAPGGTFTISYFLGSQVNPGAKSPYIKVRPMADTYPIAQTWTPFYDTVGVPHLYWFGRGLAWLLTVDKVTTEFATHSPQAATAAGSMTTPMVSTEFDRTVKAPVARATGTIVAPAEAQVREVNVMAFAATASGHMNGLVGGYSAEPALTFADMGQNVLRPLDIEEVLFFTIHTTTETITLRMEEN